MNTAVTKKFSVKPLVVAVALSMSAGGALADPPAFAVPGAGMVRAINGGTTFTTNPALFNSTTPAGNVVGDQIYNGINGGLINCPLTCVPGIIINNAVGNARGVIQWGGNTSSLETINAAGFNVGSKAGLVFAQAVPAGFNSAILNIDGSGSPSFIMGQLYALDAGAGAPTLFVSNKNGITVGAGGVISAPAGIGLIGADLNNATALNDFVGNNSTGASFVDITGGQSKVEVNGAIAGDFTINNPATFVLLAGGDIVNTGNIFGELVYADGGMRAVATKATVNGVAGTVVNRLWDVDAGFIAITSFDQGVPGGIEIASPSSVLNTGSISAKGFGWILASAANGIRSGTQGNTDPSIGLFADTNVFLFNYTSGAEIGLYNSIKGYSTNVVLPYFQVNSDGLNPILMANGAPVQKGNLIIDLLTVGSLPSSLTTTEDVYAYAENITVNSTINHKLNSAGGVQTDVDLVLDGSKSVTINKPIGAGADVLIFANGTITTNVGGDVLSDTDKGGNGGIYIVNDSNAGGSTTTIAGNLATSTASGDDIQVIHNGISTAKVVISGNVTTHGGADILVWSDGNVDLSGTFLGSDDVSVTALGQSALLKGPMTASIDTGNGYISFAAPFAQAKLYPTAVLTSPTILLGFADDTSGYITSSIGGGWIGTNSMSGVNASGGAYLNAAQKPAVQMVTNNLVALLFGSLNAPVAGETDWLQNSLPIAALDVTAPVAMSLSAIGAGPQFINLGVNGDVLVDSGLTQTPFIDVGLTSSTAIPTGPLIGNGGSSLIVNASGALGAVSNSGAQGATWFGGPGFNTGVFGNYAFEFPGGIALKAGDALTTFVPVYNAWTDNALPYQGVWLEAPRIDTLSFFATQGNARVNFSTMPTTGVPNIYTIARTGENTFGFQLVFDRAFLNTYSEAITGTPINHCPIGFVC